MKPSGAHEDSLTLFHMGENICGENGGGGGQVLPTPCNFEFVNVLTKFGTVIELCTFYPKTEELVLLIYTKEFCDANLLFSSL